MEVRLETSSWQITQETGKPLNGFLGLDTVESPLQSMPWH